MTALEVSSNPDHSCEGWSLLKPEKVLEEISVPFSLHHTAMVGLSANAVQHTGLV